ncbi:MAG TPA: hypothetical protein VHM70_13240 [Polyangiaceae bacterium]|jgi:hypothetical protein|nr:hypothetical protein [Polyangiaceae bacterium]
MTTRIGSQGPVPYIELQTTNYRVTPQPARPFSALIGSGANAVVAGAEAAAQRIPGGPEIVAAVRDPNAGRLDGPQGQGYAAPGYPAPGYSATGASAASGQPIAAGDSGSGANIEGVLARQTQDNLYYLGLQQRIQDETRNFQAVSNVLKTQHESVKNAIGNLR